MQKSLYALIRVVPYQSSLKFLGGGTMLYIDYSECKMSGGTAYSGGFNYIYHVISMLVKNGKKVSVIVSNGFIPSGDEKKIFDLKGVSIKEVASLSAFSGLGNGTLFIPLLPIKKISIIEKIKKYNPKAKVYITIHGVRRLDLVYDKYDKYYYFGFRYFIYPFYANASYYLGNIIYCRTIKKYLSLYDKVFTVSNNTMQQLIKIGCPKNIKWFYQGDDFTSINDTTKNITVKKKNYALFVSGNRPEKNLLRFMIAFLKFKEKDKSNIKLYVTGMKEDRIKGLFRCKELKKENVKKWIKFFDYVDTDKLEQLFFEAKYVVYPSKSEGFGLPVEEAIMHNKAVLASYITAIPEVADSTIQYMNPFRIDSIVSGLKIMDDKEIARQEDAIKLKKEIMISRINSSNKDFIKELLEAEE